MGDYSERTDPPIHGHMDFAAESEARPAGAAPAAPTPEETLSLSPHLTRSTVAMLLAGGRGSRLGALTDWRAKPAVPFGGKFRIVDFALSNCVNSGVRRIGILTQYKAQSLIRHVQNGWGFLDGRLGEFVELMPAQQRVWTEWYRGTADAVFQNLDILRRHEPKYVLVLASDHVYKMDYSKMIAEHVRRGAARQCVSGKAGQADAVARALRRRAREYGDLRVQCAVPVRNARARRRR